MDRLEFDSVNLQIEHDAKTDKHIKIRFSDGRAPASAVPFYVLRRGSMSYLLDS